MIKLIRLLSVFSLSLVLSNCSEDSLPRKSKLASKDSFQKTIVSSQFFNLTNDTDNVIEGEYGTFIVFPKDCFLNSDGDVVSENIKIELAEALSLNEMLLSNLTTTSDGRLLETDGMIFLNATSDGEQLSINKDVPTYIEIPTRHIKPDMMAYTGVRDSVGNMNWVAPRELKKSIIAVDIHSLDFLPDGFEQEVHNGLPFRNIQKANKTIVDSLYYNLKLIVEDVLSENEKETAPNESYYSSDDDIGLLDSLLTVEEDVGKKDSVYENYGVDPSIIKAIKNDRFQNTLISTREFERRLKVIFKLCRSDIIDLYIKNLDKNLWELDSIAGAILQDEKYNDVFRSFAEERKTKVRGANINSELLKAYYETRLQEIEIELEENRAKLAEVRKKEGEEKQILINAYKKVIQQREKYRMERYGFEQTELGWINIDRGTLEKDWGSERLEVQVENVEAFDQVFTYIVYTSMKSLYRLSSNDNITFYVGNEANREMLMPKNKKAILVGIGYLDDKKYFVSKEFETGAESTIELILQPSNEKEISAYLTRFDTYGEENQIDLDLEYMTLLSESKEEKELRKKEVDFMHKLYRRAYPQYSRLRYNKEYQIDMPVCDPYEINVISETVPQE